MSYEQILRDVLSIEDSGSGNALTRNEKRSRDGTDLIWAGLRIGGSGGEVEGAGEGAVRDERVREDGRRRGEACVRQ